MDDDNTLSPVFLETYAKAILEHPECKVFYSQLIDKTNNNIVGQQFDYAQLCKVNFIDAGVFVHHKSLYDTYGYFDTSLKRLTDWDFILRVTRFEKVFFIPQILLFYNSTIGNFPRITTAQPHEPFLNAIQGKISKLYYPFYENIKQINSINVYYDTGDGFSENYKDVFYSFPIEVCLPIQCTAIRIVPCSQFCIMRDIEIGHTNECCVEGVKTNAYMHIGSAFYFDTTDPQIVVQIQPSASRSLYCNAKLFPIDAEVSNQIKLVCEEKAKLLGSRSWKITKPLRLAGNIIRKIL